MRRAALAEGLAAYERGDFFEAHEILEPAWMGTDEPGERDVLQGLIKLSAAFVHATRGNPTGLAKNLRGARDRLATPAAIASGPELGIDARELVDRIGERLMSVERAAASSDVSAANALLVVRIARARPSDPAGG